MTQSMSPVKANAHREKAEIRAAFEPQFSGAWGTMRFDDHDVIIDAENRKAAFRWICRRDISHAKPKGLAMKIRRFITSVFIGKRFGWQGVDIFHFDGEGRSRVSFPMELLGLTRTLSGHSGNWIISDGGPKWD